MTVVITLYMNSFDVTYVLGTLLEVKTDTVAHYFLILRFLWRDFHRYVCVIINNKSPNCNILAKK